MTLLFDQSKAIEKALGEEAARPIIEAINSVDARTLADLRAEVATKADLATLEGTTKAELAAVRTDIARLDGKIDKLALQVKLLIVLALVAIAMFSPNLAALLKLAR